MRSSYLSLPSHFFEMTFAEPSPKPELLFFNHSLSQALGLGFENMPESDLALIFSGNQALSGSESLALAYSGHQFGYFNPSLGDGRALLIAEINGYDLQLKGSGRTRFSRNGDGRSALGPVIREMILSEAMHALGIPSTRALAAVKTGSLVYRDGAVMGGVFTRLSRGLLRIGTFEYAKIQKNKASLEALTQYAIERLYPEIKTKNERVLLFFNHVSVSYLKLVSQWMGVGFVHGVMNTDNASIAGETLDYGPCAFMDEFSFSRFFSSIDENGRYRYQNQAKIALWNLSSLAHCLSELIHPDPDEARKILETELLALQNLSEHLWANTMGKKIGILDPQAPDQGLIMQWLMLLETHHLDFTHAHLWLKEILDGPVSPHNKINQAAFFDFIKKWKDRIQKQEKIETLEQLSKLNPIYIPRNHLVEKAIESAYQGEMLPALELMEVLKHPFQLQKGREAYWSAPGPEQHLYRTFCGT